MSTFDCSGFKSSNKVDVNELITQVNSLAARWSSPTEGSGLISTTSSSYSSIHSVTISLEPDEVVFLVGRLLFSNSTPADVIGALHVYNSTNSVQPYPDVTFMNHRDYASGGIDTIYAFSFDSGRTGSTTYQLRWRRVAGTGTVYGLYYQLSYLIFKQRS